MPITKEEISMRVEKAKDSMDRDGLHGLLVYASGRRNMYANVLYLSNYYTFDPCEEALLLVPLNGQPQLVLNVAWDVDRAKITSIIEDVRSHPDLAVAAGEMLRRAGLEKSRVGLVGETYMPADLYLRMRQVLDRAELVHATGILKKLRAIKSPAEIEAMRAAARLTDLGVLKAASSLKEGVTELAVQAEAFNAMLGGGANEIAFTPQVSFGVNTEVCMAPASANRLAADDVVVFDMGCVFENYMGDESRTVLVGSVPDQLRQIFDLVYEAQQAAISAVRPGIAAGEVDKVARDMIAQAGYGEHFNHYTGRGMGLDLHEDPYIDRGVSLVLQPGMVFSVEPGIYLPGVGGVRIEDTVLVTADGYEVLTHAERRLLA